MIKIISTFLNKTFLIPFKNKVCKLFGHHWSYLDYSNHIKANGEMYDFKASRHCTCCNEHQYFYTSWIAEEKNKLDNEGDYFSTTEIYINRKVYS